MFIQHITIENFGTIRSYEADFHPDLNLIPSRHADEIVTAISLLLCNQTNPAIPEHWLQPNTRICATIHLADAIYIACAKPVLGQLQLFITDPTGADAMGHYQYALSHSPEQDAMECFDGNDKTIPFRLCQYRHREDQDNPPARAKNLTDTKTFRRYLYQYIHSFCPEPINSHKNYQATIRPQGEFAVIHPEFEGKIHLSETEKRLFSYICFLNVAEFWAEFEAIRDLHHEKKPLLVRNFLEFLDESVHLSALIARTKKLQRQIIILTSPMDEKLQKKWVGE